MASEKSSQGPPPGSYGLPPEKVQAGIPPDYSASPYPPPGGRRLLHLYHEGLSHRRTRIVDSDKVTPLYTIESKAGGVFRSKPHMTITNSNTGAVIGTVTFHAFSGSIDLQIHGKDVNFDRAGVFTTAHDFVSIATGQTFTWKRDGVFSGGDLKCVDASGQLCATFELSAWALQKDGKFELAPGIQGPLMDELVIAGIAIVEYARRRRNSSAGGAGGASGGGGG